MMNLEILKLGHNKINGPLPVSYASFRNLRILDLSHNELVGTLPLEYAALDNLQVQSFAPVLYQILTVLPAVWVLRFAFLFDCGGKIWRARYAKSKEPEDPGPFTQ
jgi:hypothetical protein